MEYEEWAYIELQFLKSPFLDNKIERNLQEYFVQEINKLLIS